MRQSRLTKQRKAIIGVIKSACYHPTADQIYQLVKKQLSSISVGTVYRNLDILTAKNLIKRIDIPGEPMRFDADLSDKAYFVCKEKGAIYDLKINPSEIKKLFNDQSVIDSVDGSNIVIFGSSKDSNKERSLRKGTVKQI